MKTYTLDEAARLLGVPPEEARRQLEKEKVRAFQDGRTWRYPSQAVDEFARRMGKGSDPQLKMGEAPRSPAPSKAAKAAKPKSPEDSDQVEIGQEFPSDTPSGGRKSGKAGGPPSPTQKPGSDSDVRLVADGSDLDFQVASDSDVKMVEDAPKAPKSDKKKATPPVGDAPDSGVRLVPPEIKSDSDVKIVPDSGEHTSVPMKVEMGKSPSDSDIRLQSDAGRDRGSDDSILTEEIDLDAELRKAAESGPVKKKKHKSKVDKGKQSQLPTTSPFELSESDVDVMKGGRKAGSKAEDSSSSDIDLAPAPSSSGEIELGSDELPKSDSAVGRGGKTGINLQDPADSGISLEDSSSGSDEVEFELTLDEGNTPKPAKAEPKKEKPAAAKKKEEDSDSEFELSLEGVEEGGKGGEPTSDSEFELSLDVEDSPMAASDSDSEFELTLDDSGSLAPVQEEAAEEEKDIFETDFEVPALEDESGSQAVALDEEDTDLESSDFDMALGEEDASSEEDEESGSQVVALEDEEEADDAAATIARPSRGRQKAAGLEEEEDVDELLGGEAEEEPAEEADEEAAPRRAAAAPAAAAAPVPWGPLPAIFMLPCVIVLFIVGLVGFEMLQGMWGYRQSSGASGTMARALASMLSMDLPKQ
jgi:excisionase family DNA binding protein